MPTVLVGDNKSSYSSRKNLFDEYQNMFYIKRFHFIFVYDVFLRYINTYFHCIDDKIYGRFARVQSYLGILNLYFILCQIRNHIK
jgi:hypothetical protein